MPRRPLTPSSRVISRNFFKFFREPLYIIISFVLFLKQKFLKKFMLSFKKILLFFVFFPFLICWKFKKKMISRNFSWNCPLLDSLIGKIKNKISYYYEINYLFEKHKKKKNQKTFSISGCNDVKKNSSHYIHIASCYNTIIIIIIIDFTKFFQIFSWIIHL